MESLDQTFDLLKSGLRLERDRGVIKLKSALSEDDNKQAVSYLLEKFRNELSAANETTSWESVHGSLLGAKWIFTAFVDLKNKTLELTDLELNFFVQSALKSLQHEEVRVRTEAGELLGALCQLKGVEIYKKCQHTVLNLLKKDLQRHIESDSEKSQHEEAIANSLQPKNSKIGIFHESAGWRFLETTMKCLKSMIEGCGESFNSFINQDLLDLLFTALTHTNRFVRETGFNVCASIVTCGSNANKNENNSVQQYGKLFAQYLSVGLADNWSQVRLASSVATRSFILSFSDLEKRKAYFPELIPRLCLNRYYIAEGVRIYSQKTWVLISGDKGKEIVEEYIDDVVKYYIEATQADNHAVREAACACISEVAVKVRSEAVKHLVPSLLDALLGCFLDDSWPVRDAACVACGNFILAFAQESRQKQETLYQLFLGNLKDPIPSVREGAGVAIAKYAKAYGTEVVSTLLEEIKEGLQEIKNQPENADKFVGLDKRPVQFGVAKNVDGSVPDQKHTDQQMYSCGSLAPKMGRGNSGGGCMNAKFRRPSEPWERTDGSVYLISELSQFFPSEITPVLPLIVKALSYKHFPQHLVFLETVCKQLPKIANRIGKRSFKMHLEIFFDHIFRAISCDVQLTVAAGEECLIQLGKFLGFGILRGRIENYNPNYLQAFDRIQQHPGQSNFPLPSGRCNYILPNA